MSKWNEEEIEVFVNLYRKNDVPSDSLIKDQTALKIFTTNLNQLLKTPHTEKEVAGKLLALRKSGKLPRLRR